MRLFIALPLPPEVEESLGKIIFVLKQKRGRVKWVNSKNIHLTMKFLGETDEIKLDGICQSLSRIALKHKSIISIIDRIGGFPNLKHPRVIWAGLRENIDRLEAVASDVEAEMAGFGFEPENRPFKSHLTLGRVKDNSDLHELTKYLESNQFPPERVLFDRIVLFKSVLTPTGPIYERLSESLLT